MRFDVSADMFDIAFLHEGTDAARLELGCLEYMMDQVLWGIEDNSHPKRRGWNAEPGSQGEHIKAGFGPVIIADGWAQLGHALSACSKAEANPTREH